MEQTRASVDPPVKPAAAQQIELPGEKPVKTDSYVPGMGLLPPHLAAGLGNAMPTPVEKVELNGDGSFKGRGKQPKNAQDWFKMAAASGWSRQDYKKAVLSRVFTPSVLCSSGMRKE